MRVLYIDDEKYKKREILECLKHIYNKADVDCNESIMGGIISLNNNPYDIVVLDMSLPLYERGINDEENEFEPFGGLDILDEIDRLELECKVVVITAFDVIEDSIRRLELDELDEKMRIEYNNYYVGSIHYDQSSLEWKVTLTKWLKERI